MSYRAFNLGLFLNLSLLACTMSVDAQVCAKGPVAETNAERRSPGTGTPDFNSIHITAILNFQWPACSTGRICVLFIGDSLTIDVKVHNLWDIWSGMAAMAHDFVYLTASHIQGELGACPLELFYDNGGNSRLPHILAYLQSHPELKPSLVVLQGREDDPFDANFTMTYTALLDYFRASKLPTIVLSDFWSAEKEDFGRKETLNQGLLFVDINAIQKDPAMSGDGGPHNVPGVQRTPTISTCGL